MLKANVITHFDVHLPCGIQLPKYKQNLPIFIPLAFVQFEILWRYALWTSEKDGTSWIMLIWVSLTVDTPLQSFFLTFHFFQTQRPFCEVKSTAYHHLFL